MDDQGHALAAFPPGIKPGTNCKGGWVGSRGGLDGGGKISCPSGFDSCTVQTVVISYPGLFMFGRHNLNSKST